MHQQHSIEKYLQNDYLLAYIHNTLSDEERMAFEKVLEHDEMLQDAVEGLRAVNPSSNIQQSSIDLAHFLHTQTAKKTKAKKNKNLNFVLYTAISIILLLTLLVGIYLYFNAISIRK